MPRYTYVREVVNYNTWIRDTLVPAQQSGLRQDGTGLVRCH